MARKKITTIKEETQAEEMTAERPETETIEPDSPAERLALIMAEEDSQADARIYRRTKTGGREFLEKVYELIDEEYLAENFGPGSYVVNYTYKWKGKREQTTFNFLISGDCVTRTKKEKTASGGIAEFLENLNAEKIAGIAGTLKLIRDVLAPPPPPVDLTELIKVMAQPKPQPYSDAVIIEAMRSAKQPAPAAPSLLDRVKEVEAVKALIGNNSNDEDEGGESMDYIKKGLELLPLLLKFNGGSYEKAGASVRENPQINSLIREDPELATKFITAARDKFGEAAAQDLARGFGYEIQSEQQKAG